MQGVKSIVRLHSIALNYNTTSVSYRDEFNIKHYIYREQSVADLAEDSADQAADFVVYKNSIKLLTSALFNYMKCSNLFNR